MSDLDDSDETISTSSTGESDESALVRIGRYRVLGKLGKGSFAQVFLGYDDELDRRVAIKVALSKGQANHNASESYLAEARTLAQLDHPNIVPIYDVGQLDDGRCFIVSKFVDGETLAARIARSVSDPVESVRLVAMVANALDYAHAHNLFHRDVKPANILVDVSGRAILVDFGLAMKDEHFGKGAGVSGTPAYMSPEQARGESHRVDGRSDIFSLGVVFYELLTGRRPFRGESISDLLGAIQSSDPRPPRQWLPSTPKDVERICLKALEKRPADRYSTARDLAEELQTFLVSSQSGTQASASTEVDPDARSPDSGPANLLHAMWGSLDESLQDAFSLAYNKKRRQGGDRISTKDFFQALVRLKDESVQSLIESLPAASLPEPIDPAISKDDRLVLREAPLLSDCVTDSLEHFGKLRHRTRRLSPADLFVDVAKYGHGESVAKLRAHGIGAREIDERVERLKMAVLRREGGGSDLQS